MKVFRIIVTIATILILYKLSLDAFVWQLNSFNRATQIQRQGDYFNKNPQNHLHEAHFVA